MTPLSPIRGVPRAVYCMPSRKRPRAGSLLAEALVAEVTTEQPPGPWPTTGGQGAVGADPWVQAVMTCVVCRDFKSSNEAD